MQPKHITQDPNLNTDPSHLQQTPQPATTKSTQAHTQTPKTACSSELKRKQNAAPPKVPGDSESAEIPKITRHK